MTAREVLRLDLDGLGLAPSQVWGAVRIVPVLRNEPMEGLRLHRDCIDSLVDVVTEGPISEPKRGYISYVPHAFVVQWGEEEPRAAYGAQLSRNARAKPGRERSWIRVMHRMARRESGGVRFLPLHFAMEGYLALQFGGPSTIWSEYSNHAIRDGLSPRVEWSVKGKAVPGLADALRVFEIHPNQVGVLLFVGDVFQSAFVTPRHDEYRLLHRSIIHDFFADTIVWNALQYPEVPDWTVDASTVEVESIADLRAFLERTRRDWADFHGSMATGLFESELDTEEVFKLGRFSLRRFLPSLDLDAENHIGEAILDSDRRIGYLKTLRLSAAQAKRGFLLKHLAAHDWDLGCCADAMGSSVYELVLRLKNAGFGYLLRDHVIRGAERALS